MQAAIDGLPKFEKQAAVKTGTDDISADGIGFEMPENDTPKITPIQSAKATNTTEKAESHSLNHRICENGHKKQRC